MSQKELKNLKCNAFRFHSCRHLLFADLDTISYLVAASKALCYPVLAMASEHYTLLNTILLRCMLHVKLVNILQLAQITCCVFLWYRVAFASMAGIEMHKTSLGILPIHSILVSVFLCYAGLHLCCCSLGMPVNKEMVFVHSASLKAAVWCVCKGISPFFWSLWPLALWVRPCPLYLFLVVLNFSNLKPLQYHHLPRQVVTPYKPQDDTEHHPLGTSASDGSDRAPLLKGTGPDKLTLPSGELVSLCNTVHKFFLMNPSLQFW